MSNTIYVDCNRQNSSYNTTENNEWTYKLNTEMTLPKGTIVELQQSFINKKGINGGSIEIDEDIIDEITYVKYITEDPQFQPVGDYVNPMNSWFRSTLACSSNTFKGNFADDITPSSIPNEVLIGSYMGATPSNDVFNGQNKSPYFTAFGGCSQILPLCKWQLRSGGGSPEYYLMPKTTTVSYGIPKGVYGIGELGQLIEDQINGVRYYDVFNRKILNKDETTVRRGLPYSADKDLWDGQIYNKDIIEKVDVVVRNIETEDDLPEASGASGIGYDCFLNSFDYEIMMNYLVNVNATTASYPNKGFDWNTMRGRPAEDAQRAEFPNDRKIRPFYYLKENLDTGVNSATPGARGTGHVADPGNTISEYWMYSYNAMWGQEHETTRQRLVGTADFTFTYDTEKNGFSINGLHNQKRSSSHDRMGGKISSAGQPVFNMKKIRRGAMIDGGASEPDSIERDKVIGALNTPETRDMGVMILNWGKKTTDKMGTTMTSINNADCARFSDWFETRTDAINAWKTTIWYRLGFDYDQLNDSQGTNVIYNKAVVPDYGFTTNTPMTNDIIPTTSTLNNPLVFMQSGTQTPGKTKKDAPTGGVQVEGLQMFNVSNTAIPYSYLNQDGTNHTGMYSNSLYMEAATVPVIVADVGGVVANRLPTLSKHPYYLITSDINDNYKDNVKKGDVLPLLGVVPKTSLSNQDFITADNQISQVISQDKVINKIHIKILNPDLTAPNLEENSSVLLKITMPNITPISLLPPKVAQQIQGSTQSYQSPNSHFY